MQPTLVVMAAGLGSRFGGVKQLAQVGPNGEAFLDLSITDALKAGFTKVVLIVRADIEQDVRDHISQQHPNLDAQYVRQGDLGPARDKPWGTMHAIVSATKAIDDPFCVINADDYYGPQSFNLAASELEQVTRQTAATVAFEMAKTLPPSGSVSRGICEVDAGRLISITEAETCQRHADGRITADGLQVDGNTPVSMNIWCFHHDSMPTFFSSWTAFLEQNADEERSECQIPTVVSDLMSANKIDVSVVSSTEQWIGITNPEDFELAKAALADR